MSIKCSLHCGL